MRFAIHMHVNSITECCPVVVQFTVPDKFVHAKTVGNNDITELHHTSDVIAIILYPGPLVRTD